MRYFLTLLTLIFPLAAGAQSLTSCNGDGAAGLPNLVEPIEQNTRSFANGNIRLLLVDFVEPACCWAHIVVLHPPAQGSEDEAMGQRMCTLVSMDKGYMGFNGARLAEAAARYDPAQGLAITIPVGVYSDVEGPYDGEITLIVNQATGTVTAQ